MAAPVLTLSSASSPSSSNPYLANGHSQHTPDSQHISVNDLAALSRNASVMSSSSSSSSSSSIVAPVRPRPLRTFSNHSASTARARSPNSHGPRSPTTPTRGSIPAAYLPRSLSPDARLGFGAMGASSPPTPASSRPGSRHTSRPPNNRSRSNSSVQKAISADDFEFGDILGSGSYSSVISATNRNTGQTFAIKVIDKAHIIRHRKTKYANIEKTCLARLSTGRNPNNSKSPERNHSRKPSGLGGHGGHPGVIRMHSAFHDESSLYFVLDLAPNGELLTHIRKLGSLSYPLVKYYTAQLVDTLEYVHSMNILHRDVKPENILLDAERRMKLADFGSAKILDEEKTSPAAEQPEEQRASSFVGSALYVSPELLMRSLASKSADVWAMGSIIYYMIAGDAPFKSMSEYLTFEKIKKCEYSFPSDDSPEAFDPQAKDLIQKIFVLDPTARYTTQQIRAHPFLSSINWATLWTDPAPPIEPGVRKNLTPPISHDVFDDEDEDVGDMWDEFVASHGKAQVVAVEEEDDDDEGPLAPVPPPVPEKDKGKGKQKEDPELARIVRMYGKGKAVAAQDERSAAPFPMLQEADEHEDEAADEPGLLPEHTHQGRVLSSVAEEETTPKPGLARPITPPKHNSGFVVLSRHAHLNSGPPVSLTKPLPIVADVSRGIPPGPGSACSATSSEGSPIEATGTHMPVPPAATPTPSHGLGLFTRVWGKKERRGSSSSNAGVPAPSSGSGGLGLSVWSGTRRGSFGTANSKRLSPDLKASTPGSRRLSNNSGGQGGSTRSSSTSRKGSRSGSNAARTDVGKWSSIFLPGEQVVFHSQVHSRTRHGLFPAKKRVLVLTDLPRLLCVKDTADQGAGLAVGGSSSPGAGEIEVKREMVFCATTSTTRPPILSKISERSGETATGSSHPTEDEDAVASTEEATVPPSVPPPSRRPSLGMGSSGRSNVIKNVEAKGDKCFVVRTSYKAFTYITDDSTLANQWVREIEEVRSSMQGSLNTMLIPPSSS